MSNATPERRGCTPEASLTVMQCLACAETRTTRQTVRWPDRRLRCAACGLVTLHRVMVDPEQGDWREDINARFDRDEDPTAAERQYLEQLYCTLGIAVRYRAEPILSKGKLGVAAIVRDRTGAEDAWSVEISPDATLQGRLNSLRHAFEVITDSRLFGDTQPGHRCSMVCFGVDGDMWADKSGRADG